MVDKLDEGRLQWYGHVHRRDESDMVKRAIELGVEGAGRRGQPKKRWKDCVGDRLRARNIDPQETVYRPHWRHLIMMCNPE